MAYTFDPGRSVQDNVRHIGKNQVDKALAKIDDNALDIHNTVHQIRKRCKKVRGLVRLVRPYFDDYSSENLHRDVRAQERRDTMVEIIAPTTVFGERRTSAAYCPLQMGSGPDRPGGLFFVYFTRTGSSFSRGQKFGTPISCRHDAFQ